MEKKCCDIKIEEIENGFCIKVTEDDIKERFKGFFKGISAREEADKQRLTWCPVRW